jgi:uncharacterized protein YecA (UPF0149 family)
MTNCCRRDPTHPAYAALRESFTADRYEYLEPLDAETEASIGRSPNSSANLEPARASAQQSLPCGSGKKYKVCCGRKS